MICTEPPDAIDATRSAPADNHQISTLPALVESNAGLATTQNDFLVGIKDSVLDEASGTGWWIRPSTMGFIAVRVEHQCHIAALTPGVRLTVDHGDRCVPWDFDQSASQRNQTQQTWRRRCHRPSSAERPSPAWFNRFVKFSWMTRHRTASICFQSDAKTVKSADGFLPLFLPLAASQFATPQQQPNQAPDTAGVLGIVRPSRAAQQRSVCRVLGAFGSLNRDMGRRPPTLIPSIPSSSANQPSNGGVIFLDHLVDNLHIQNVRDEPRSALNLVGPASDCLARHIGVMGLLIGSPAIAFSKVAYALLDDFTGAD